MTNRIKLLGVEDLHLINILMNFDKFKPTLVFTDDQRLRVQHADASDCRLALQVLHEFEFSLNVVDLELAVPAANKNVRLSSADGFCLL